MSLEYIGEARDEESILSVEADGLSICVTDCGSYGTDIYVGSRSQAEQLIKLLQEATEKLWPSSYTKSMVEEYLVRGVSLRCFNLSGLDLSGVNFSGADLTEVDFSGADLSGANFFRADLSEANLSEANLRGANLSKAFLIGADLEWVNLKGTNLDGAVFG